MTRRRLFGTDGIRGKANEPPMTVEMAVKLGRAVARIFTSQERRGRIVVGKDTRLSCYMFETSLAAGICSMGADCWVTGPMPTPGIAHITSSMRADAGLVISASHNPFYDNGIKVFAGDGFKLPDDKEEELERLMESGELESQLALGAAMGRTRRVDDALGRYIAFLKATYPRQLSLDGIKIVVDCANGAAYKVAPAVFEELGAEVIRLGVAPNGKNINDACGALHPEDVQAAVREHGANLGVALDGDADRVILVDEKGEVADGDAIMALLATRMLAEGTLRRDTLVVTVMSNLGLERCVIGVGGKVVRTPVGDRHVVEAMRQGGYNLGGEQSGHLIFLDHMTTGDGVVGALQVLSVMVAEGRPLSELAAVMTRYPQVLVNVVVDEKRPLADLDHIQRLIRKVEQDLGDEGRILVRYSGTEALARVMVEGPDKDKIRLMAEEIAEKLKRACAL